MDRVHVQNQVIAVFVTLKTNKAVKKKRKKRREKMTRNKHTHTQTHKKLRSLEPTLEQKFLEPVALSQRLESLDTTLVQSETAPSVLFFWKAIGSSLISQYHPLQVCPLRMETLTSLTSWLQTLFAYCLLRHADIFGN